MADVVLYFQVHQPYRVRGLDLFEIGSGEDYFGSGEADKNEEIMVKVAEKCYLPANKLWLKLLEEYSELRLTYGISGLALEQFERYTPEVLESFEQLLATGRVELLAETYHHSLASVYSPAEFEAQVKMHEQTLARLFDYKPTAFRNTELIYNNDLAEMTESMGYEAVLAEGVERYLGWRSPNFVYAPKSSEKVKLLLKNYRLSDDVAFRFSDTSWGEWPLGVEKYASWVGQHAEEDVVNIFMDYETIGEHQWVDTGIFEFLERLPEELLSEGLGFETVSGAATKYAAKDIVDMPEATSWADTERDLSAWAENPMQRSAVKAVYEMQQPVLESDDEQLIEAWRKLQASDHFYYMSTKSRSDGEVHQYFSPHDSPFSAYTGYMNVLHDLRQRVYTGKRITKKKTAHV